MIGFTQPTPGTWVAAPTLVLTPAQAAAIASGGTYFNVHTAAFPGGEIRAQANGRD